MTAHYAHTGQRPATVQAARVALLSRIGRWAMLVASFSAWYSFGVDVGFQKMTPTQGGGLLAVTCAFFAGGLLRNTMPAPTRRIFFALATASVAIIILAGLSIINAPVFMSPIRFMGRYAYGLMLALAAIWLYRGDEKFLRQMVIAFLLGGAVTLVFCFAGHVYNPLGRTVFQDMYSKRAMGFLQHPNQLAMLYVMGVGLSLWSGLHPNPRVRLAVTGAMVIGVVMTGSKFNMAMSLLLMIAAYAWLPWREGKGTKAVVAVITAGPFAAAGAALMLWLISVVSPIYFHKLSYFADNPTESSTTEIRLWIWGQALNCGIDHPFIGVGANSASYCFGYPHAHNVVMNYMAELGMTGAALLIVFLGCCLAIPIRASAYARRRAGRPEGVGDYRLSGLLFLILGAYFTANMSSDSMGPQTMQALWVMLTIALMVHGKAVRGR